MKIQSPTVTAASPKRMFTVKKRAVAGGKTAGSIDLRIKLHRDGQKFLRGGKAARAIGIFERALRDHGSHLGLLSDLCAAQYLDGR